MPKTAETLSEKIVTYTRKHPEEFERKDGALFCKLCKVSVSCDKKTRVESHRSSATHQGRLPLLRSQWPDSSNTQTKAAQICEAFLKADIPLHKLRHPAIKELFEKNKIECPGETTCRNAVKELYAGKMEKLKEILKNKKISVQCDESEVSDKKFVHVLVGERPFLVTSKCVETVDSNVICNMVDDSLRKMGIEKPNFWHFLTDAAAYMKAAGEKLKTFYPNMLHTTCLAHLMHNVAENVRARYPDADFLIASVKAAVTKNQQRRKDFHAKCW